MLMGMTQTEWSDLGRTVRRASIPASNDSRRTLESTVAYYAVVAAREGIEFRFEHPDRVRTDHPGDAAGESQRLIRDLRPIRPSQAPPSQVVPYPLLRP